MLLNPQISLSSFMLTADWRENRWNRCAKLCRNRAKASVFHQGERLKKNTFYIVCCSRLGHLRVTISRCLVLGTASHSLCTGRGKAWCKGLWDGLRTDGGLRRVEGVGQKLKLTLSKLACSAVHIRSYDVAISWF